MRDVLDHVRPWFDAGERFALATVIDTFRSAPRQAGAAMAVSAAGEVVGSVSGGCVEGAVYELAREVIETGRPVVQRYGVADDDAFAVGLTCGGVIDILVQPIDRTTFPEFDAVADTIDSGPVAIATVVRGERLGTRMIVWPDRVSGGLGDPFLDSAVTEDAVAMLEQGSTAVRRYGPRGQRRREDEAVFVQSFAPPARLFVFGAIDFAAAVARAGKFLGYRVTVCDARPVFATSKRFPDADEVIVDWPHRFLAGAVADGLVDGRTAMCVLTHDPKFDVPLLELALRTDAGYIGAMGSRRTHADRLARLSELGLADSELARLRSPIGLDLGARTPEETAVSIAAEIIADRWGATGRPLSRTRGRIHGEAIVSAESSRPRVPDHDLPH
ncbi:xanthine dehydrogenase accessory factor [Herbihabitans rhizosphaerae]|uniref:Xanthine dehydrogenase accessory factor n=1 Tax=Herbihabitans rhizosphaerae TaxID=1872711 RepID=A0A4V2ES50_9PSEU|nr:XdhC/CoxI family protein [Herbihabitans rhizosphaerae]RZS36343.1 xanthine dehydrogenase accessory factor [Herbihabitans rhizosphaerae]